MAKKKIRKETNAPKARKVRSSRPRALITGVTGQDGSYLAELLLEKGYDVYGLVRHTSAGIPEHIEEMNMIRGVKLLDGNLRDIATIRNAIETAKPDEIYNLAAQSHVGISFKCPDETWETNYFGVGRLVLTATAFNKNVRIYQASTSEMFGKTNPPQNEKSPFQPVSPYAEAKLRAHEDFIKGNRENKGLFAAAGILFNHESPRRGKQFVTRKITRALANIKLGKQKTLDLGNMDARRDWGYAGDYVKAMHMMLQHTKPDDYVIATGKNHSVRDFVNAAANFFGMPLTWSGKGVNEVGKNAKGEIIVRIDPQWYRPAEVDDLRGDSSKARRVLGWKPEVSFEELVEMMAKSDYDDLKKGR
jgi:GDPmannose 4,6-dehydratase